MTSDNLIGKRITDIYEKVVMEPGGLDTGEIFFSIDTGETLSIPYKLEYKYCVVAKDRISNLESIYNEFHEDGADWTITDLIEPPDHFLSEPYIELKCGLLFTVEIVSPHGTGMAGIKVFANLKDFEAHFGKEYRRLSEK